MLLPGDTLESVAHSHGLSAARLAAINHIAVERRLRPGDVLAVPTSQEPKRATTLAISKVHISPPVPRPEPYRHVVKNGYDFAIDRDGRTREIDGFLSSNPEQARDRRAQSEAGGVDRLRTDHGGHYIARRFNGPTDAFNHFAQDGSFNKRDYAKLENEWAREMSVGHRVRVDITPLYLQRSKRPFALLVNYEVAGVKKHRSFYNIKRGK